MKRVDRARRTPQRSSRLTVGTSTELMPTRRTALGFSLIETLIVVAIGTVMTVIAIPITLNAMRTYRQAAAVAAATGAIQAARYSAVMHGYPYEVTFTPSTNSYQIYYEPSGSSFTAVPCNAGPCGTIPISRPGDVTMTAANTFIFSAGGTVTGSPGMTLQITNGYGGSNTITVSGVGNVTVTSP
jgi:type II secretory pathway pseudopilin PulG